MFFVICVGVTTCFPSAYVSLEGSVLLGGSQASGAKAFAVALAEDRPMSRALGPIVKGFQRERNAATHVPVILPTRRRASTGPCPFHGFDPSHATGGVSGWFRYTCIRSAGICAWREDPHLLTLDLSWNSMGDEAKLSRSE